MLQVTQYYKITILWKIDTYIWYQRLLQFNITQLVPIHRGFFLNIYTCDRNSKLFWETLWKGEKWIITHLSLQAHPLIIQKCENINFLSKKCCKYKISLGLVLKEQYIVAICRYLLFNYKQKTWCSIDSNEYQSALII